MILHIVSHEKEKKSMILHCEVTDTNNKVTEKEIICKNACNTTIAKSIMEYMDSHKDIKRIIFSDPALQVKQDKIFKLIKRSPTYVMKQDGKIIRRYKLLEMWTAEFSGKVGIIQSGEYENQMAVFQECTNWMFRDLEYTVQLLPGEEQKTLIGEKIVFIENYVQRRWLHKEDEVPCFLTLANKIAGDIGIRHKEIDIDAEIEKHLQDIEEKYGTFALYKITLSDGETKSSLKRIIQKRTNVFMTL